MVKKKKVDIRVFFLSIIAKHDSIFYTLVNREFDAHFNMPAI